MNVQKTESYTDQGLTIQWYKIRGFDAGTARELDGNYGIWSDGTLVDSDNMPMIDGVRETIAVRRALGI